MNVWNGWQVLREIGDEFSPRAIEATRDLYVPIAQRPDTGAVSRDLAYGPDPRHRLDVFAVNGASARPVVVFVHGGGFAAGDKGAVDAPFYNNVGAWAVRNGFVGVNITYRLAPSHGWPAGACDVALAMEWVRQNIGAHGGDPRRIVLIGQSAGGAHVAGFLAGQGRAAADDTPVAAAVLLSGIFEPDAFHVNPMHEVYFGADRALQARQSAVLALAATAAPCLFTISEFDPPQFHRQLGAVVESCVALRGRCPETLWLPGHNHFSTSMQIGSPFDTLGDPLAAFVRRCCA